MKNCLLFFFVSLFFLISRAQNEPPQNLRIPITVSRSAYSNPGFYFGIGKQSDESKIISGGIFRTFKMVYEIAYQKAPTSIMQPQLFIGFLGFEYNVIEELDSLWTQPSDTLIQPHVQNLLSDIINNNSGTLGVDQLSNVELIILDLSKNSSLQNKISSKMTIPSGVKGILYLVWNKEKKSNLPPEFIIAGCYKIKITQPYKYSWKNSKYAESSSKPESQSTSKTPSNINPVTVKTSSNPAPISKNESTNKSSVHSVEPKSTSGGETVTNQKMEEVDLSNQEIATAPAVSSLIYPELLAIIHKKNIPFPDLDLTLSLSKKNDTLKIFSKSKNKFLQPIPLQTDTVSVSIEQDPMNRRSSKVDAETKRLILKNISKFTFQYKGQKLFFDTRAMKVFLPVIFNSSEDIKLKSEWPCELSFGKNKKNQINAIKAYLQFEKASIQLKVLDQTSNQTIPGFYILMTSTSLWDTVFFGKLNSGNEISGLLKMESIKYNLMIYHPDYDTAQVQTITYKDLDQVITLTLIRLPSFNIFYVQPKANLRPKILKSIEERLLSVVELNQPYLLFISNSDKPLVVSDLNYGEYLDRVNLLYDDTPNLELDFSLFSEALKSKDIPKKTFVKIHFYLPASMFNNGWKTFVDRVVNDDLKNIYNIEIIGIYIYMDGDPPEMENDRKFYNLLNE